MIASSRPFCDQSSRGRRQRRGSGVVAFEGIVIPVPNYETGGVSPLYLSPSVIIGVTTTFLFAATATATTFSLLYINWTTIYLLSFITSKRIKLESPGWSGFVANSKNFKS